MLALRGLGDASWGTRGFLARSALVLRCTTLYRLTDATQLALMIPKDMVEDAFEVARSALHMLVARSQQLQRQVDAAPAAPSPSHERQLDAMRVAIAGHSSSVASLSDLMGSLDEEERVAVPVGGRAVNLPRGASLQVQPRARER
eukprot:239354-Chlamydomonas_euryale.AAC.1